MKYSWKDFAKGGEGEGGEKKKGEITPVTPVGCRYLEKKREVESAKKSCLEIQSTLVTVYLGTLPSVPGWTPTMQSYIKKRGGNS